MPPFYRRPADLVEADLGICADLKGRKLRGQIEGNQPIPIRIAVPSWPGRLPARDLERPCRRSSLSVNPEIRVRPPAPAPIIASCASFHDEAEWRDYVAIDGCCGIMTFAERAAIVRSLFLAAPARAPALLAANRLECFPRITGRPGRCDGYRRHPRVSVAARRSFRSQTRRFRNHHAAARQPGARGVDGGKDTSGVKGVTASICFAVPCRRQSAPTPAPNRRQRSVIILCCRNRHRG
jgi:hypothetical protein